MRTIKFKIQTALIIVLTIITVNSLQAQMLIKPDGNGTSLNSYAMLQLVANGNHFGFMIPSVNYTSLPAATTDGIKGLLVFVTANGPSGNDAFYFSDGSAWRKLDVGTTSTQWTTSGSDIYYNTGNVGIGTTTPVSKLHIAGADMNNALLFENTSVNAGRNYILFKTQGTEQGYIGLGGGATNHMSIAAYGASNNLFLETNGLVRMTVLPSGNVGIGTTTPYTTLTVGSTDATAKITAGGANTTLTIAAAGSDGRIYFNAGGVANGNYSTSTRLTILPEGRVGIGTTTPGDLLQVGNLMFGGNSGREISSTSGYDINYKATGSSSHHFYANGTEIFTIDKTGNIGIGVNSPSQPLHMSSGAHVTTAGVWTNASDSRLKTNVVNTNYGLQTVMQLRPVNYNMIKGGESQVGFLAQEVQKIVPEVVSGIEGDIEKGETLGLSYGNLVPVLTKAIQEQQNKIDNLEARLSNLERNNQNSVTAGIGGNNLMVFSVIGLGIAGLVMYGFKKRTKS